MPPNIRYMSEAREYLLSQLPFTGKYILNKSLTGCGGTQLFLTSGKPLVLISPRSVMLKNKFDQHPGTHLFRASKAQELTELKRNLKNYLLSRPSVSGLCYLTPIILTTLDSAKYVIEELEHQRIIDHFFFLVDEFQNLIGDATFKGKTELEFLMMLDRSAKNICYMSATPIQKKYLELLTEFKGLDYYELEWDTNVIVEPTVRTVLMKKGEKIVDIFQDIFTRYRKNGYFEKKIINGQPIYAKEAVFFINEVGIIERIIKQNNLNPDETTILISESADAVLRLKKQGFKMGGMNTDRNTPTNKTFTFCSKASFEGCDFYSQSAFTYIFLDSTKDWQTHDIAIEIPQMLGRQRLDENPFKYNATIYYRTNSKVESQEAFFNSMERKFQNSMSLLTVYETGVPDIQKALVGVVENKNPQDPYTSNYLDVIHDTSEFRLEINYLVAAAEHNLWENKAYLYNNPLHLTTAIQTQLSVSGTKPCELRDFEELFYLANENEKLRLYTTFRNSHPYLEDALYQNPFINSAYHEAFYYFGAYNIAQMGYDINEVAQNMQKIKIANLCQTKFVKGKLYLAKDVKLILQEIYDAVGITRLATASQLEKFVKVSKHNKLQPDGRRERVYIIS